MEEFQFLTKIGIKTVLEDCKINKIEQPESLEDEWRTDWIYYDNDKNKIKFNLNWELNKIVPQIEDFTNNFHTVLRFSPFNNFDSVLNSEYKVFDNVKEKVDKIVFYVFINFTKQQEEEFKSKILKFYKSKFKNDLNIAILKLDGWKNKNKV